MVSLLPIQKKKSSVFKVYIIALFVQHLTVVVKLRSFKTSSTPMNCPEFSKLSLISVYLNLTLSFNLVFVKPRPFPVSGFPKSCAKLELSFLSSR